MTMLVAGLFGHRRAPDPFYASWFHAVAQWTSDHWQVLAVVIPVGGGIAAGIINHYLSLSRENRTRRLTRRDLRVRVHADLAARLLAHCSYVQNAYRGKALDAAIWRRSNASLYERAQMSDLIDVLGPRYVTFMAAIEREKRIVDDVTADAKALKGAREVLQLYAPFIAEFGEPKQARRLKRT
ncbi:MAG TPA: hypothetical protein VGG89_15200 [Candidatus Baltobacteraceae bacterium]